MAWSSLGIEAGVQALACTVSDHIAQITYVRLLLVQPNRNSSRRCTFHRIGSVWSEVEVWIVISSCRHSGISSPVSEAVIQRLASLAAFGSLRHASRYQRGVQWKQGLVVYIISWAVLLYNTTPIHCTPLPLHPPVMNTHRRSTGRRPRAPAPCAAR